MRHGASRHGQLVTLKVRSMFDGAAYASSSGAG